MPAVFNNDDDKDWKDVFSGTLRPEMLGLLGTPVLERLHLDGGSIRYDPSCLWGRGVLSEGAYSNLRWLHICGGTTLGLASDLHDFLRRLPAKMEYLVLERLNVSHIDMLHALMEILRAKSYKKGSHSSGFIPSGEISLAPTCSFMVQFQGPTPGGMS